MKFYKHLLLITVTLVIVTYIGFGDIKNVSAEVEGLNEEIFYKLSGAWDDGPDADKMDWEFSWGTGKCIINSSIIIDFGAEPPLFFIGGLMAFDILAVKKRTEDRYEICLQERGASKKKGCTVIHFTDEGAIWFEKNPEFGYFYAGKEFLFYRISAPKK